MSPVSTLVIQRSLRRLGRIRTGNIVAAGQGKTRPAKLDTFRFTSETRSLIDAAQEAFGGTVRPWTNPATGKQEWEVITETDRLDIVVPPGQPVSQWMELYRQGGCERRCDGVTETISRSPCKCPSDTERRVAMAKAGEACKITTRLSVMLPQLPDLGSWLLETHSFYAATELAGTAEVLAAAAEQGRFLPARLRLDQREKKIPNQPTNKFGVPIIELVDVRMGDLALTERPGPARIGSGAARPLLPATTPPASSDMRAPGPSPAPEPITREDFLRRLGEAGFDLPEAYERAGTLFPDRPRGAELDGVQLATLLADLTNAAPAAT